MATHAPALVEQALVPEPERAMQPGAAVALAALRSALVVGLVLLCAGTGLIWYATQLHHQIVSQTAEQEARLFADAIIEFRSAYTDLVVKRLTGSGADVTISHNFAHTPGAIPLPATFTRILGQRLDRSGSGIGTRMYSPFPFKNRIGVGGLTDDFAREAWAALSPGNKAAYSRIETLNGQPTLRYAVPDRLRAACVECHNAHPDSVRKDWQVGDVRGVLEVRYGLAPVLARSAQYARGLTFVGVALLGLAALAIGWMMLRLRREGSFAATAGRQLAATKASLELKNSELYAQNLELGRTHAALRTAYDKLSSHSHALKYAKEMAEQGEQAKSAFVANMSHELRTPLNGVLGMLDVLREAELSHEEREYVDVAYQSGQHLLTLVNDILDIAKLDAGKVTFEEILFSPSVVVERAVASLQIAAKGKPVTLSFEPDAGVELAVYGDPTRLRQIVTNLVGNALKFTLTGEVRVMLRSWPRPDEQSTVLELRVQDTGIGIAPDALESIFGRFTQADNSMTRQFGGSGLGLALTRALAQQMGGDVTVESERGKGSTFTATVAMRMTEDEVDGEAQASTHPRTARMKLSGRVLLVEDNPVNQRVIRLMLERIGLDVELVENGRQAVEALEAQSFDAVLMDCNMPVMDGFEAARTIRTREGDGHRVPILALTANAMAQDESKCLEAGMDAYLAKPVDSSVLISSLRRYAALKAA